MNPVRVELSEWGCVVSIIDDRLYSAPLPIGPDFTDEPLALVDFVCRHFLADVNRALRSDFTTHEFHIVSCEGCWANDAEPELHAARLP